MRKLWKLKNDIREKNTFLYMKGYLFNLFIKANKIFINTGGRRGGIQKKNYYNL